MIPPLAALQAFETIARRKSFSLAAEELHLTPSAVSHQVAKLEGLLNVRLFERSARGVELTPAGQQYLQRVGSALGAIHTATEDKRQGILDGIPLARIGEPNDVAGCVVFLASDLSKYCTGVTLDVNGGMLIH